MYIFITCMDATNVCHSSRSHWKKRFIHVWIIWITFTNVSIRCSISMSKYLQFIAIYVMIIQKVMYKNRTLSLHQQYLAMILNTIVMK